MDMMNSEKQAYFVDLVSGDILEKPLIEENPNFRIYATEEELADLKLQLEKSHTADLQAHIRSLIPYVPYHKDKPNDQYDASLKHIYAIIYQYGDEEARRFIDEIGILEDNKFEGDEDIKKMK